jgi:hypothetical protein
MTLDPDIYMPACLLRVPAFQVSQNHDMATIDSQVLRAMSAISSWAECSNVDDRAID